MAESPNWLDSGTPHSPQHEAFLHGCGLPAAWANQPQWRILDTSFGAGLNFLATWSAWRADPQRPTLLHVVALQACPMAAADWLHATSAHPDLAPLAQALHHHYWGLLPGIHRIALEEGRVLLTLCIGDAQTLLRQQDWSVDSVYLDGVSTERNPGAWSLHTLKALARCCRRGTRLTAQTVTDTVRDGLVQCGFTVAPASSAAPSGSLLQASFDPRWEPRAARQAGATPAGTTAMAPSRCIVVGAGLSGAAVAASLARRGWQVQVLDQAEAPAAGASGLPAGLFCPHVSPDDSVLSRLSRSGVRTLLAQVPALLHSGTDWQMTGVLEHRVDGSAGLGPHWHDGAGPDWSHTASTDTLHAAGLPQGSAACWHVRAGWVRPARLVAALLAQPGITWQGGAQVARLQRTTSAGGAKGAEASIWQALDAHGAVLAQAPLVVLAAGPASAALSGARLPLQALRGQISWGLQNSALDALLPPFPVNGSGHLVAHVPQEGGQHAWHVGSTFERDITTLPLTAPERASAHTANYQRLQTLLPQVGAALQTAFAEAALPAPHPPPTAYTVRDWAQVRATAPDRLPLVGPIHHAHLPGLWTCTAMGARGLTLALLCGELLAARLQGEPLPLDSKLARALGTERL